MASKKDMRRADLAIPYVAPAAEAESTDLSSSMASTLPMAAIFTRQKGIGWVAFVISLQSWLAETAEQKKTQSTPGYFSVGMSLMALAVCYMNMFIPQPGARPGAGTGTDAPPPQVPSHA